ncbi:MAG: hypothetical protein ACOYMA_14195 [Bacteroidia bacterium]
MIVYGSKSKVLATENLMDKCPNCGTQNSVELSVLQKYGHVFWIPFFPMGKTGISNCSHCKQVLELKEMPDNIKVSYENLKPSTKTPIWMFSGLALVAVLIIFGVITNKKKGEKNAQLIITPQSGDIFEIKTKDNQYTLYKIDQVVGDSVFVQTNNYETNKLTGLNDLKSKEYSEDVVGYTKAELKQMLDNGEIIDIERK